MADKTSKSMRKRERNREKKENKKRKRSDVHDTELVKHYEAFYEQPPPGIIKENDENPEDCIPDLPENKDARQFLAHAPSKGLWMPLGKEVKVMKCWRCKAYGHRTGDRECPLFISGNKSIEKFRMAHEDPMHEFIQDKKKAESESRIEQLKALLEESTTSESDGDDSSSVDSSSSEEEKKKGNRKSKIKHKKKSKKKHKHKRYKSSKDSERYRDSIKRHSSEKRKER